MNTLRIAHLLGGGILCGAGQYAMKLMEALEGDRFHFMLISLKDGPLAGEARRRGLETYVLGKARTGDPRSVLQIARLLKAHSMDLVHTHTTNSNFYGVLASFLCPGCRPVATLHAYYEQVNREVTPCRFLLRPGYRLDLFLLKRALNVISVSRSIEQRLTSDGFPPGRIRVIPNGIDVARYAALADREGVRAELGVDAAVLLVGTAGRLAEVKNQHLFLRAAAKAHAQAPDLRFVLFGEGPEEESLRRLAKESGIAEQVIFAGWRQDIARCLSALDLFVLSSRSEVSPFVLLEAMALGVPVIATDVGGVREMMEPSKTGLLTGSDDDTGMAEALLSLAGDPARRREMGRLGREFVKTGFSEKGMLEKTADVYLNCLAGR